MEWYLWVEIAAGFLISGLVMYLAMMPAGNKNVTAPPTEKQENDLFPVGYTKGEAIFGLAIACALWPIAALIGLAGLFVKEKR